MGEKERVDDSREETGQKKKRVAKKSSSGSGQPKGEKIERRGTRQGRERSSGTSFSPRREGFFFLFGG